MSKRKINGMNIQVVAGQVTRIDRREVRDRTLTTIRLKAFDFSILVWNRDVEAEQGDYLFVQGRVQSRSYDKDGTKHYVTEIVANHVANLSRGQAGNGHHLLCMDH